MVRLDHKNPKRKYSVLKKGALLSAVAASIIITSLIVIPPSPPEGHKIIFNGSIFQVIPKVEGVGKGLSVVEISPKTRPDLFYLLDNSTGESVFRPWIAINRSTPLMQSYEVWLRNKFSYTRYIINERTLRVYAGNNSLPDWTIRHHPMVKGFRWRRMLPISYKMTFENLNETCRIVFNTSYARGWYALVCEFGVLEDGPYIHEWEPVLHITHGAGNLFKIRTTVRHPRLSLLSLRRNRSWIDFEDWHLDWSRFNRSRDYGSVNWNGSHILMESRIQDGAGRVEIDPSLSATDQGTYWQVNWYDESGNQLRAEVVEDPADGTTPIWVQAIYNVTDSTTEYVDYISCYHYAMDGTFTYDALDIVENSANAFICRWHEDLTGSEQNRSGYYYLAIYNNLPYVLMSMNLFHETGCYARFQYRIGEQIDCVQQADTDNYLIVNSSTTPYKGYEVFVWGIDAGSFTENDTKNWYGLSFDGGEVDLLKWQRISGGCPSGPGYDRGSFVTKLRFNSVTGTTTETKQFNTTATPPGSTLNSSTATVGTWHGWFVNASAYKVVASSNVANVTFDGATGVTYRPVILVTNIDVSGTIEVRNGSTLFTEGADYYIHKNTTTNLCYVWFKEMNDAQQSIEIKKPSAADYTFTPSINPAGENTIYWSIDESDLPATAETPRSQTAGTAIIKIDWTDMPADAEMEMNWSTCPAGTTLYADDDSAFGSSASWTSADYGTLKEVISSVAVSDPDYIWLKLDSNTVAPFSFTITFNSRAAN